MTVLFQRLPSALLLAALLLSGCGAGNDSDQGAGGSVAAAPVTIESGRDVVRAMFSKHADAWYETLTFEQETIEYRADGPDTTTWFEAMRVPGELRIDIGAPASGNGYIFRNDSLYVFSNGEVVVARETLHPLLILGFDVYGTDPEETLTRLDSLGFDLDTLSENEWQGREVYVVGAETGDERTAQFWIDRERLLFVRMIQPAGPAGETMSEVQFNNYRQEGEGWIAPEVLFFTNGTLSMSETYSNVQTGVDLAPALFVPATALATDHWVPAE